MLSIDKLIITRVKKESDYWDKKTQKRIKYKTAKYTKKVVFNDDTYGMEDLFRAVTQESDKVLDNYPAENVYLEVKFKCTKEIY